MSTTEERLKKLVADQLGVKVEEVTPTANFRDDLGADSLDEVEMIMEVESEFDIEISDEDAETIHTFDRLVLYVDGRLAK